MKHLMKLYSLAICALSTAAAQSVSPSTIQKSLQNAYSIAKHLSFQLCRLDTIIIIALALKAIGAGKHQGGGEEEGLLELGGPKTTFTLNLPTCPSRIAIEIVNLAVFGFLERWIVLKLLHVAEEGFENVSMKISGTSSSKKTSRIMTRALPLSKAIRDQDFKRAQSQPWFHNKMAILLAIGVLLPFDLVRAYCKQVHDLSSWTPPALDLHGVEFEVIKLCKDLLVGLFVIDVILGTAHKLSHEGPFKKYLFRYHAQHHTRHHNYSAVKYVGNPFDLEVVLTQVCYAFLPRVLGLDVWTSIFLIDLFSLQLLLEHTGCTRLFALSQHHEMHHNHGNVAFYHFPLTELVLGNMPSLKQLSRSSCDTEKK